MVRVGLVGVGFMGWIHHLAYQRCNGVELAGFCSRSEAKRAGDWTAIKGNFGPPGEKIDVSPLAVYETIEELVNDDSIDVIDICLPPNLHRAACLTALKAGKHVLCEKPLALQTKDCDELVAAAEVANKLLMVAHVLPFFPAYQVLRKAAQSKAYGALLGGTFKRVISDPTWIPDFYDPMTVGGSILDLHIHDAHLIELLFGKPKSIVACGQRHHDVVKFAQAIYQYENSSLSVAATTGVIDQQGRPFTHGFEVRFEEATLNYELGAYSDGVEEMPLKILKRDGSIDRPDLSGGDDITAFEFEISEMIESVRCGKVSDVLSAATARNAIETCHRFIDAVV